MADTSTLLEEHPVSLRANVVATAGPGVAPWEGSGDLRASLVETRRGPVECAVRGDGPAVLCLHGAMGGYDQALLLACTLGPPGLRYVAISRPGYLGTPLSVAKTLDDQAGLYRDVLDALGIGGAAVMAVSGGGPSALQFALTHRERCWGAVIVSSVCSRNDVRLPLAWYIMKLVARLPPLADAMRRKVQRDPERATRRSIPDAALRQRTLRDPVAGPLLRELQMSTMDRVALRLPGTENDVAITRGDVSLALERIAVPVLVVHGTQDRVAPFAQGLAMSKRIPGAKLLRIEGGDHVAIFTHHGEAKAEVSRFLLAHASDSRRPPDR